MVKVFSFDFQGIISKQFALCLVSLFGLLVPTRSLAEQCDTRPTARALVAPWSATDHAYLDGRKKIDYYFEMSEVTYRVFYGDAKGFISAQSPSQIIASDPFYDHERRLGRSLIDSTDKLIDLDFNEVKERDQADLLIVGYCNQSDRKEGAITQSASGAQYVMILNGCRGVANGVIDPAWLFLHEFGHALGLEHPFSDIDGDCLFDNKPFSPRSADSGLTVMAYKQGVKGPPSFFTAYDLSVLRRIWGAESNR